MKGSVAAARATHAYVVLVIAVLGLIRLAADRWWPATLLMFAPRWIWLVPAIVLAPVAWWLRPRLLWWVAGAAGVVIGPIMGLSIPWRTWALPEESITFRMRLLSCNVHRTQLDGEALGRLIAETRPDVMMLQDWTSRRRQAVFGGYHCKLRRNDEVLTASRFPMDEGDVLGGPDFVARGCFARNDLETPIGTVHIFNVHLNSPRRAFEAILNWRGDGIDQLVENSAIRRAESIVARRLVDQIGGPVVIAGDFNTPTDSPTFREAWGGLTDAYSFAGLGWGNTYFTRHSGMRIDHILVGPGWRCRNCFVGPSVGSPHRPLIADLEWTGRLSD